jgi:hypothetical protein
MGNWPGPEFLAVYDPPRIPPPPAADATAWSTVPVAELRARQERVERHQHELAAEGVYIDPGANPGELRYFSTDVEKAERLLRQRFGADVPLRYAGASLRALRAHPFGSWLAEGSNLHVFYGLRRNGERFAGCVVAEDDNQVIVSLMIVDWLGAKTLIGGFAPSHATVALAGDLGDRPVIDNFDNRARPHWKTAAAVPLPRPQDL